MVDPALRFCGRYHEMRNDPVTLFYEADLFLKMKRDHRAALSSFLSAWEADPRNQRAYSLALDCMRQLGMVDEIEMLKQRWQESKLKN